MTEGFGGLMLAIRENRRYEMVIRVIECEALYYALDVKLMTHGRVS